MARFNLSVAFVVGLVCLLDHSRAVPLSPEASEVANPQQIPNFPGPGEIPKPPGMLHSRVARNAHAHEIPGQDQFPSSPPPPPQMPSMRARRDAGELIGTETVQPSREAREKREAKGTGKLPRKAG